MTLPRYVIRRATHAASDGGGTTGHHPTLDPMSELAAPDPAARPAHSSEAVGSPTVPPVAPSNSTGRPSVVILDADDRPRASLVGLLGIRHRVEVLGDAGRAQDGMALI